MAATARVPAQDGARVREGVMCEFVILMCSRAVGALGREERQR